MTDNSITRTDDRLKHIAFIMDGNGRWATARNMPRKSGHKYGVEALKKTVEYCHKIGIKYITVYAFSTENWKRPKEEVDSIMNLLETYLDQAVPKEAKIRFIGDVSVLSDKLKRKIAAIEASSAKGKAVLNIAMNYGSRSEIVHAFNTLIEQGKTLVDEDDISSALYTSECPDPDLIVRTGGDLRISNFLLWQAAYSELYFTDTLWPDMCPEEIDKAINAFYSRKRRYGGLDQNTEK